MFDPPMLLLAGTWLTAAGLLAWAVISIRRRDRKGGGR